MFIWQVTGCVDMLAPGTSGSDFEKCIFYLVLLIVIFRSSYQKTLKGRGFY